MCKYLRDGRAPLPEKESTSLVMHSNKAKGNKLEAHFSKLLSKNGIKGYRKNLKTLHGRPDFCFTKKKIAIFINGCFWHKCPKCNLRAPKSHSVFWLNKFKANQARDMSKELALKEIGWEVMTIWECELKKDPDFIVKKIMNKLK